MKTIIKKGYGFELGQDFARAKADTPVTLAREEYAKPGHVIGYINEDPAASLGFLKYGHKGKVRVHVLESALAEIEEPAATATAANGGAS